MKAFLLAAAAGGMQHQLELAVKMSSAEVLLCLADVLHGHDAAFAPCTALRGQGWGWAVWLPVSALLPHPEHDWSTLLC